MSHKEDCMPAFARRFAVRGHSLLMSIYKLTAKLYFLNPSCRKFKKKVKFYFNPIHPIGNS